MTARDLLILCTGLGAPLLLPACGDNRAGEPESEAPAAAILSPSAGERIGEAALAVRVRLSDDRGIASARLEVSGGSVAIDPAALDGGGEATVSIDLAAGAHRLRLVAADAEGQEAYAEASIEVDLEAPRADVLAPRRGAAETRRLLYAALADDAGIAAVSYAVNGGAAVQVPIEGAPAQVIVREALPLAAGPNTVELRVVDALGHERVERIELRYGLATAAGGAHSGAIDAAGGLQTWGRYNVGQLGLGGAIGDAQSRLAPERVPAFGAAGTAVAAISFNQNTSLAVRSDGTVWTWGANGDGQLGHGDLVQRTQPAQVAALSGVVYAALGYSHALALRSDGAVLAWGKNASGQAGVVGNGTATDDQLAPVEVAGLPADIVEIAAGSEHSVALAADGRVFVWGRNDYGNLGQGAADTARHPAPEPVPGLGDVIDIANGRDHVVALRADGTVVAWGLGASGQLGYGVNADPAGEDRASPVQVFGEGGAKLERVRAVLANGNTSYALVDVGGRTQLWGWGQNFSGQLATGATSAAEWSARRIVVYTPSTTPVFLDEMMAPASIGTGATHTIVRAESGALFAWGWNFRGSLGVPSIANAWAQTVAVEVSLAP